LLWCILECKGFRHFSFDILVGEWHILHHSWQGEILSAGV
jgi:hypothetical protein